MTVETATGKAKCVVCCEKIPKGVSCWHQGVNSRSTPFFCGSCLGRMSRMVDGLSAEFRYEVHEVNGEHFAKQAEYSDRPNAEGPWLVEISDMARVEEEIALAEGIPTENVRLSTFPKYRGVGPDIFFAEIPNMR